MFLFRNEISKLARMTCKNSFRKLKLCTLISQVTSHWRPTRPKLCQTDHLRLLTSQVWLKRNQLLPDLEQATAEPFRRSLPQELSLAPRLMTLSCSSWWSKSRTCLSRRRSTRSWLTNCVNLTTSPLRRNLICKRRSSSGLLNCTSSLPSASLMLTRFTLKNKCYRSTSWPLMIWNKMKICLTSSLLAKWSKFYSRKNLSLNKRCKKTKRKH